MTIKVSAVENEIGRVKCYQSKVKENQLILKIWWSAIPGGVDIYTPGGVEIFMYTSYRRKTYRIRLLENYYAVME